MKNRKFFLRLLGLSLLAAHAGVAFAEIAGQTQFVNGEVRLINAAGEARALQKGDAVNEGDTLDSAKGASAQIRMQDGGFVAVRSDTKLKFDSFKFKGKEDGTENSFFSLFKGGFRAVTGLIGRINKQNYRITTPVATIGIRGTDHESFYAPVSLPGILAGAYSKVNIGETSLTTEAGAINVKPNQMGFAGGLGQLPQLQPLNTNIFTVTPAPASEARNEERRDNGEQGGEQRQAAQGAQSEQGAQGEERPARQLRDSAVVDNTASPAPGAGGASGMAGAGATSGSCCAPSVEPPVEPNAAIIPIIINVDGQPVDLAGDTQPAGIPPQVAETAAQAAAAAAQAAATAAQAAETAATAAAADNSTLAGVTPASTAPATSAIGTATTGINTAGTAVSAAAALASTNAAAAVTNASTAQAAATTAASLAAAAQSAFAANGAFADTALAAPANTATQSANSALQSANTLVQTAAGSAGTAGSVAYYNAALSSAQAAANTALGTANTNLAAANSSLTAAGTKNAAIITAQGATATPLAAAQAAATAARTAATAAQAAATLAASLQAAGDIAGAQAQLVIAQQQLAIAQAERLNAQKEQAAVNIQLTDAQAAKTAAGAAVTATASAANTAASDAGAASAQAGAAQATVTNAGAALTASANNLATVNTNAPIVAANAPVAAYSNPAVVAVAGGNATNGGFSHWGLAIQPAPKEEFVAQDSARPQANYVLDGNKNLIQIRGSLIDGNGYDYFNPSPVMSNANVKLADGIARDHFHFADSTGYMGRWEGGNIAVNNLPYIALGTPGATGTTSLHWGIFLSPASSYVQSLGGTATYTLDAKTHPTDSFGNVGTLTGATLVANFDTQMVNAAVNFSFANNPSDPVAPSSRAMAFSASANNIAITGSTFDASPAGRGALVFACTGLDCNGLGYQGDIAGQFVGADAIHAALGYSARALQPGPATATTAGGSAPHTDLIQGLAAFSTAIAPSVPSVTSAAYTPDHTLIELAAPFMTGGWNNYMAAPGDMVYTGASYLTAFTDRSAGGDGSIQTNTVIGGAGAVTGAGTSVPAIMFGRWTSVTAMSNTHTKLIGGSNWNAPRTWMYGPRGYLDAVDALNPPGGITAPGGQMYNGTFNYTLNGSTAPYDRQSGQSGTLSSASITANFTTNLVSASLGLAVGGQNWSANTTAPVSLSGAQFFASSYPGGASNNLTVDMGLGTPTTCTTCFGNLKGAFTAQNYYGAILSYNLWNNGNGGGDVAGHATLVRSGAITDGTPVTPVNYFVADQGGDIKQVDTLNYIDYTQVLNPGLALTSYSSGNSATPGAGYMATSVAGSTTTSIGAPGGIFFGTWSGGSYTSEWGSGLGSASPHWITGPEAGPLHLPNALLGTKTYTFDGGMVTNMNGAAGTVNTAALTVDFTKQVVGININLSVPGIMAGTNTWNAATSAGNEAPLNSGDGVGGAVFRASSKAAPGPGLLTVTMNGVTPGSGNVSGQLTGTGLNSAILSYDLNAVGAYPEYVNGVAALAGATSSTATPYRWVLMSATDPGAIIRQPMLGGYANAPARMAFSGANLTQFDMRDINGGDKEPSHAVTSYTSTPASAGNDPVTGISWGRWDGGSVNITNRATGVTSPAALAGSLHWIAGPTETAAVTLPVSGTYAYINTGGTAPTDSSGNAGTLNSAALSANFTAQTVNVGVNVTVAGATMDATASNVPIIQRAAFSADSRMSNAQNLAVTCSGTCGATHQGRLVGGFNGAGATGAIMTYGLEKIGGASPGVISGVAAFKR